MKESFLDLPSDDPQKTEALACINPGKPRRVMLQAATPATTGYRMIAFGVGVILLIGLFVTDWAAQKAEHLFRSELLAQAEALARTIDPHRARQLSFAPDDLQRPEFELLRDQFVAYQPIVGGRGIWTAASRGERLVFGPESYPPGDPLATPPGTPYEQPTPRMLEFFRSGRAFVEGPYTDEFGSFVSAVAPVLDPHTGEVLLAVVVDVQGDDYRAIMRRTWEIGIGCILTLTLLFVGAGLLLRRGHRDAAPCTGWRRHSEAYVTAGFGLVLSALAVAAIHEDQQHSRHAQLRQLAEAQAGRIRRAFSGLQDNQVGAVARFYEGSEHVDRSEFHAFAKPIAVQNGVMMVGWAPRTPADQLQHFENSTRGEGFPGFEVWEAAGDHRRRAGRRDTHFPVLQVEPPLGNDAWVGFDLASEPACSAAMDRAARHGMPTMSDPIHLGPQGDRVKVVIVVQPVFLQGYPRGELSGFALAVLDAQKLTRQSFGASASTAPATVIDLYSVAPGQEPEIVACSWEAHTESNSRRHADPPRQQRGRTVSFPVFAFDRTLVAVVRPGPAFAQTGPTPAWIASGLLGIALTSVVSLFVGFLVDRRSLLETQVQTRTAELREQEQKYRAIYDHMSLGVAIVSPTMQVLAANRRMRQWFPELESDERPICHSVFIRPPRESPCTGCPTQATFMDGEPHEAVVTAWIAQGPRQFRVVATPLTDESGRVTAAIEVVEDVTEQVAAAQLLRDSEEQVRTILDTIQAGVLLIDADTHAIARANRAALAIIGDRPENIVGHVCHKYVCPAEHGRCPITDLGQTVDNSDRVLLRADGTAVPILKTVTPMETGGRRYLLESFVDITERKEAEERLRASREQFMLAVSGSQDGIWDWDIQHKKLFLSPKWKQILGYEDRELPNAYSTVRDRLHPEDRTRVERYFARYLNGRLPACHIECRLRHKDGSYRWVLCRGEALRNGEGIPYRMAGSATDITERKQTEEALRASEARIRAITDSAQDAILMIDGKGLVSYWNPAAERILGYSPAEALGREMHDLLAPARYRPACNEAFPHFVGSGQGAAVGQTLELHALRKDGCEIAVSLSLSAVQVGGEWHAVGILRDVTAQKKAEQELRDSKEALERINAELEASITHANQMALQAEAASRAKSEFLANMSHEIRTPMTAILGYAELVAEGCATGCRRGGSEPREALAAIRRNGDHLLGIISDILDLSKIEAGQMTTERVACSPSEIVAEVAAVVEVRARAKSLDLRVRQDGPAPGLIYTDPLRLRQILVNLAGNAVKFTAAGSVSLNMSVSQAAADPRIQFDVIDTGVGLNPDQADRLFQPFAQADGSTTRLFGGTGLGLAISRKLARLLGGTVVLVRSEPGVGSHFRLELPIGSPRKQQEASAGATEDTSKPSSAAAQAPGPIADVLEGTRILLVEDGPDNQLLFSRLLTRAGAKVDVAENGRIGLEKALAEMDRGSSYQLILMDMQMPEMDGYEATTRLRAAGYMGPIVALTAHALDAERQRCFAAGCDDFASKPIDRPRLLDVVSRNLRAIEASNEGS